MNRKIQVVYDKGLDKGIISNSSIDQYRVLFSNVADDYLELYSIDWVEIIMDG